MIAATLSIVAAVSSLISWRIARAQHEALVLSLRHNLQLIALIADRYSDDPAALALARKATIEMQTLSARHQHELRFLQWFRRKPI